jgi:hypothetical protein
VCAKLKKIPKKLGYLFESSFILQSFMLFSNLKSKQRLFFGITDIFFILKKNLVCDVQRRNNGVRKRILIQKHQVILYHTYFQIDRY